MLRLVLPVLVILAFANAFAPAQQPQRTHDITVADYFTQRDLFDCRMSPNGEQVAYILGEWQKSSNDRKTNLWVVESGPKKAHKLTFDRANDRHPRWSKDGKYIYFLGNRKREGAKAPYDGNTQVWRIRVSGGDPVAMTRVDGGVQTFELAPKETLIYTTAKKEISKEWKGLKSRFTDIAYGHGVVPFTQVWKVDLKSWRPEKILDEKRVIRELTVSPNGQLLAMITTPDGTVVSNEGKSRVDIYDHSTGKVRTVPEKIYRKDLPSPYAWLGNLAWSRDNRHLAFNVIFDAYPSEVVIVPVKDNKLSPFLMKRPDGVNLHGYGTPLAWKSSDQLCFLGDVKGRVRLFGTRITDPQQQTHHLFTPGDVAISNVSFDSFGDKAALILATPKEFPDIYELDRLDRLSKVTDTNPQTARWKLPSVTTVSWEAADGTTVEGILELPPGYKKGQKLPLAVAIHGGPTTCTQYKRQFWIYGRTLLATKGYAVLCPNYRGSTGYGDKFLTDLVGRENDVDVSDILSGVDALVERGIADPDRMAVMGWSNGGYLTNCIITGTNRFQAAISGAGITDAVLEFGSNDEPAYAIVFKKGFPWSNPKSYHRASPSYHLDKIRTPTLIHVGQNDERCPPGNSQLLYRTLKEYLNVPTEYLVYKGAGHGLTTYNHRLAKLEWDLAWLDRYVTGKKE